MDYRSRTKSVRQDVLSFDYTQVAALNLGPDFVDSSRT